jgi:hypothetical protein
MLHISFNLPEAGSPWRKTWDSAKQGDPATISEMDLRYRYCGVNASMVVEGVEVISNRRSVTLVDLALSLFHAGNRISAGEDAVIGFTESAEVIRLRHDDDRIVITSSKHSWQTSVDRGELLSAFTGFLQDAYMRLTAEVPGLAENQVIQRFAPK